MRTVRALVALPFVALAQPASSANVTLNAALTSSCTLALSTSGVMTTSASGTILGSEQSGGTAASMTLVALGTLPTVTFAAPSLTASPAGWTATSVKEIKYTSSRGANQAYTAAASSYIETGLTDTFIVNGRMTSTEGFAAGNYTLTTVVTCS